MLNALVVDDEKLTRETLYHNIPWDSLGFTRVQQASNGLTALELAAQTRPDLILSDIRMPKMDGIELGRELRTLYPDCKIIYLSAYADKEYFKSAIKLNAVDYIEKPIVLADIIPLIRSIAHSCLEENKRKQESFVDMQQKWAVVLCSPIDAAVALQKDRPVLHRGHYQTVLFLHESNIHAMHRDDLGAFFQEEQIQAIVGVYNEKNIVAHILMEHETSLRTLQSSLEEWIQICRSKGVKLHISVGNAVHRLEEIHESYAQAAKLSSQLFYLGYGHIVTASEQPTRVYQFHDNLSDSFHKMFKERQQKEAMDLITSLINEIRLYNGTPVNYIKNGFFSMISTMNRFLEERHLVPENVGSKILNENKFVWEILSSLSTLEELGNYTKDFMRIIFDQLDNETGQMHTAYKIKKYIEQNAQDSNLSIQSIARHFFLSPNYTSFIFKKECKITINQYVTTVRMNKAKQLLSDDKITLIEIAALVGYSDAKYFARVFKKEVGFTTSEYRERHRR